MLVPGPGTECVVVGDNQQKNVSKASSSESARDKEASTIPLVKAYQDLHQDASDVRLSASSSDDSISADIVPKERVERFRFCSMWQRIPSPDRIHKFNKGDSRPRSNDSYSGYVGGEEIDYTDPHRSRTSSREWRSSRSPPNAFTEQPSRMSLRLHTPEYMSFESDHSLGSHKKPCYLVPLTEDSRCNLSADGDSGHDYLAEKSSGISRQDTLTENCKTIGEIGEQGPPSDDRISPSGLSDTNKMLDRLRIAVNCMDEDSINSFVDDDDDDILSNDGSHAANNKKLKKSISRWLQVNNIHRHDIRKEARQVQVEYDQTPASPKRFLPVAPPTPPSKHRGQTPQGSSAQLKKINKYMALPSIPRRQQAEPVDYGYHSVRSSHSNLYAPLPLPPISKIHTRAPSRDLRLGGHGDHNLDDLVNDEDGDLADFVLVANKIKGRGCDRKKNKRKNLLPQPYAPASSPIITDAQDEYRHPGRIHHQQPLDINLPSSKSHGFSATHSKFRALPAIQTKQLLPTDDHAVTKVSFVPTPPAAPKKGRNNGTNIEHGQRSFHRRHKVVPPINTTNSCYEMPPQKPGNSNKIPTSNSTNNVVFDMWCQGRTVKGVRKTTR